MRILAAGLCLLPACLGWVLAADASRPGIWLLGLYRERWFAANLALSYLGVWAMLAICLRLRPRTIARGLLVTSGIAVVVLLSELAAFLGWLDFRSLSGERPPLPDFEHQLRRTGVPHQEWQGPIHYDLSDLLGVPSSPQGSVSYRTDRFGIRNPPGREDPDIILLGDSILVGSNLEAPALISQRLQEQVGLQVINVAQVKYAPQESLSLFRATGITPGGRTLLHFIFEGNDLADSKSWRAWLDRPFRSEWPANGLIKGLSRPLKWSRLATNSPGRFGWISAGGERHKVYFLYDARPIDSDMDEMPHLELALSKARHDFGVLGARYEIVFVPAKIRVLHGRAEWPAGGHFESPDSWESAFAGALSAYCEGAGIPFHDTTAALTASLEQGELPFFALDTHLNAVGHQAIASFLAKRVGPASNPK